MLKRNLLVICLLAGVNVPVAAQNCGPFTDVAASDSFCASVLWMRNRGVTVGCTATQYCPADNVSRAQMALFMSRLSQSIVPAGIFLVAPANAEYTSIQAAIDAAAATATEFDRKVVRVAPGIYNEQVTLKDFVNVEGAGIDVTAIYSGAAGGTLIAGAVSQVRNLSVWNYQQGTQPAVAVMVSSASPNSFTLMQDTEVWASGQGDVAVIRATSGSLSFDGRTVFAAGQATTHAYGIHVSGPNSSVRVRRAVIIDDTTSPLRRSVVVDSGADVRIAHSQLGVETQGAPVCFSTYDNNFVPRNCL